jgi:hypothetical protein
MKRVVCADCGTPRPGPNVTWPVAACTCGSTLIAYEIVHTESVQFAALIPPPPTLHVPTPRRRA